jgi:hypothetical protein
VSRRAIATVAVLLLLSGVVTLIVAAQFDHQALQMQSAAVTPAPPAQAPIFATGLAAPKAAQSPPAPVNASPSGGSVAGTVWHDTSPTPAPAHTSVADFRDEFYREIRGTVAVTATAWTLETQAFEFLISNANPFPITDVSIGCRITAPSGTEMGDALVTVYEIVPANAQKHVHVRINEFFEINTYRFSPFFPSQATGGATCSAGPFISLTELDGIPVKTDAQLRAWCTRYHRCGL